MKIGTRVTGNQQLNGIGKDPARVAPLSVMKHSQKEDSDITNLPFIVP
jgi:hypothetical protein